MEDQLGATDKYKVTVVVEHGDERHQEELVLSANSTGENFVVHALVNDHHESPECRMSIDIEAYRTIFT